MVKKKSNGVDKSRRSFIKKAAIASLGVVSVVTEADARPSIYPPDEWYGMLYDATRCVGCKACMSACKRANGLPPEYDPDRLYDAPVDLSSKTANIIKLHLEPDGRFSYIKRQCMHCVDPACVSACPLKAMRKDQDTGIVYWDGNNCIGCRYCMVACPFNIPKFEWDKAFPKIVKCMFCKDTNLKEKGIPACCEACPAEAVIFGKRNELLHEAKRRIKENPDRYTPKVYGEKEVGGTAVLYLASLDFKKLGLPDLPKDSPARFCETVHHGIYKTVVPPILSFGVVYFLMARARRRQKEERSKEDKK